MRVWFAILALLTATPVFADVTAVATVDQRRIGFGDSFTYTITINGASGGLQAPNIPPVDGLQFQGPSVSTSMSWVNGQSSQAVNLTYRVTPTRLGQFTIPAAEVTVAGKTLRTEPITIAVEKNAAASTLADGLFARIQFDNQPLYLGQTAPLNIVLFVRGDVPLQGLNGFQAQADGLNYKFLDKVKQGTQVISGQNFSVLLIDGAITPTQVGKQPFGPVVIKCQLRTPKRGGNDFFDQFFNRIEVREVPLTVDPITIDVLPLPDAGRPAEFAGAVGQWKLDVTAKPTEVAIGDPITLTIRISGTGNIDLVTPPKLTGLDEFKTYDPTTKTSKNELNTAGERVIQQVLVPKSTAVKQLPEIRLSYFDPVTKTYTNAVAPPINLTVKTGTGGQSTVISAGLRVRPEEKLGQDIVYLKGDRGPAAAAVPFCATPGSGF